MPHTPLAQSMMDLLAHISLPAADRQFPAGDTALADPAQPLLASLPGPDGLLDGLLAEVEEDLHEGRTMAAGTALGLVGTRLSLDAARGVTSPRHVEWLADHLRKAAAEMAANHPAKALKAVRLARLALRP